MKNGSKPKPVEQRFWPKVNITDLISRSRNWLAWFILDVLNNKIFNLGVYLSDLVMGKPLSKPLTHAEMTEMNLAVARLMGQLESQCNHPCPMCKGKGAVLVNGDDAVACPMCKGTRIDPDYITAFVKL